MRALYRTSFEIRSSLPRAQLFDEVANLCWAWIYNGKRGPAYKRSMLTGAVGCVVTGLPPGHSLTTISTTHENHHAWGLVFRHPDHTDANLSWQTEVAIGTDTKGKTHFSCSSLLGRNDGNYAPSNRNPSRPRIVNDVLNRLGGYGAFKLTSGPISLEGTAKSADQMLALLEDKTRTHPVVFVSFHEQSKTHLLDVRKLADLLGGLAHVVVAKDADANRLFNDRLAFRLNCFAGAVRIYWPGFSRSSPGWEHPLWTTEQVVEQEARSEGLTSTTLLRAIADVAAFNLHPNFYTWERVQEIDRRRAIAAAIASNQQSDLLKLYEEENAQLATQINQLKAELATSAEGLHQQRSLAESYRLAFEQRKTTDSTSVENALPPSTVREAVERAEKKYADRLVFCPNSKSDYKTSPFEKADEVFDVFDWLASFYIEARMGKRSCPRFDHELAQILPGWDYSAKQSEITLGANAEWYHCTWEGRRYEIGEHIRRGSSRREEEAIRIAFAWDAERQRVVIGYIGQHQKNTKS